MKGSSSASGENKWLPDEARLIALVSESGGEAWAAGVAIGLADMVGSERGRTFLANAAGSRPLDDELGGQAGAGLTSALTGAASLASVARRPPGQRFAYVPAGEAALPFSALRRMEPFRRFLRRAREGGGTVLLYLGEADLLTREKRQPGTDVKLDGCIALGGIRGVAEALDAPLLARVERPLDPDAVPTSSAGSPAAATAAAIADPGVGPPPGPSSASPASATHGGSARAGSITRVLVPIGLVALVWVTAAILDRRDGTPAEAVATTSAVAPASSPQDGRSTDRESPAQEVPAAFAAPPASYSILVGSYIRLSDALERRDQLASDGGLFFVSPTPVRGRIYQRVLAGVFEDRSDALEAMRSLVDEGRKEVFKEWDVRPVRLAFDLGTFADRSRAESAAKVSTEAGVPAYVLGDTSDAPRYRVYAGAFERESAAAPAYPTLAESDTVPLIQRTGVAP